MASIRDYEIVLASIEGLSIWNFYPTVEAARADMERANSSDPNRKYEPMDYSAYKAKERSAMLDEPAKQITAEKFMEMLEVLPPLKWEQGAFGFESFLMSEFWSGPYTHQYARRGDTYWCKMVDAYDRSTWMTGVA